VVVEPTHFEKYGQLGNLWKSWKASPIFGVKIIKTYLNTPPRFEGVRVWQELFSIFGFLSVFCGAVLKEKLAC